MNREGSTLFWGTRVYSRIVVWNAASACARVPFAMMVVWFFEIIVRSKPCSLR